MGSANNSLFVDHVPRGHRQPVTVQPDWTPNHRNPTEQLPRLANRSQGYDPQCALYAAAVAPWTAFAAARITLITKSGWESMITWLLATSFAGAPTRLPQNRPGPGWPRRA